MIPAAELAIELPRPTSSHRPQDPSPEEIEAACLAIQATWTDEERERRWQYPTQHWLPPGAMKHRSPEDSWRAEHGLPALVGGGGNYDRGEGWEYVVHGD